MKNLSLSIASQGFILLPLLLIALLATPLGATPRTKIKYLVLRITDQKEETFHKALSYEDQDSYQKKALEEYKKAKDLYLKRKEEFEKNNRGKTYTKKEPRKPIFRVAKRGLTDLRDAMMLALELDKKLKEEMEKKNGKNGSSKKKSSEKNGTEKN